MNDAERIEVRRWAAGLMGWETSFHAKDEDKSWISFDVDQRATYHWDYKDWTPDLDYAPASQLLSVIDEMRRRGLRLKLQTYDDDFYAAFTKGCSDPLVNRGSKLIGDAFSPTLPLATLKAARATGEK
jgi:hypothetical protein